MDLTLQELERRANRSNRQLRSRLKEGYDLAKRLGFSSPEAVVLQSHKREVIIKLAIEKGLITDGNDPRVN